MTATPLALLGRTGAFITAIFVAPLAACAVTSVAMMMGIMYVGQEPGAVRIVDFLPIAAAAYAVTFLPNLAGGIAMSAWGRRNPRMRSVPAWAAAGALSGLAIVGLVAGLFFVVVGDTDEGLVFAALLAAANGGACAAAFRFILDLAGPWPEA